MPSKSITIVSKSQVILASHALSALHIKICANLFHNVYFNSRSQKCERHISLMHLVCVIIV